MIDEKKLGWTMEVKVCSQTLPLCNHTDVADVRKAADYFPNIPRANEDGKDVCFYNYLIKDKIVVINFIFTNCGFPVPRKQRGYDTCKSSLVIVWGAMCLSTPFGMQSCHPNSDDLFQEATALPVNE
ncbi:hypothetical protein [Nitrosomonas sp. Nm33]|uniref:hypothetical protein n=1 Tax=Nitrosomonas sp. Nm33 TaxID=133724 RepID=UPI000B81D714|nr:hypothetical protein [Nitrosomonas sp. Nm33]